MKVLSFLSHLLIHYMLALCQKLGGESHAWAPLTCEVQSKPEQVYLWTSYKVVFACSKQS
jgi:hypothetical protein